MYRAALALATADLDGTITHAREALSLAPQDDALARAAAGALAGLASWSTGDLSGAHAAYTESIAGLTSAGFLADVLGCTITLGDIRRTQGQLAAALRTYQHALDLTAPAPGTEPLTRNGRHARRNGRGAARAQRPRAPHGSTWPSASVSVSTTACRRTRTAGGSSWLGCAKPKATSTTRSRCSTRPNASTPATTPRTCSQSRRCEPGYGSGAASSLTRKSGPGNGS